MVLGYCVKGRHKTEMMGAIRVKVRGRHALKGKCGKHGTTMFKFVAG